MLETKDIFAWLHRTGRLVETTLLPIAGHILTDNLHSRRTDTLMAVSTWISQGPFRMQLSSLLFLVHLFIHVYLSTTRECIASIYSVRYGT